MDTEREIIHTKNYEDYDPGSYIEEALDRIDRNFERLFNNVNTISSSIDLTDAKWRVFSYNGVKFRIGEDDNNYFALQQALTELGFDGVESVDEGVTGDYITIWKYNYLK